MYSYFYYIIHIISGITVMSVVLSFQVEVPLEGTRMHNTWANDIRAMYANT